MRRAGVIESRQTREARAAADEAAEVYSRHVKFCVTCEPRRGRLCADGKGYRAMRDELRAALERERADDRKPAPGQAPLFDLEGSAP